MDQKHEDIRRVYERLAQSAPDSFQVYAGKAAQRIAEEMGVDENWKEDRLSLQEGQEWMNEALSGDIPTTPEQQEEWMREMVSQRLRAVLNGVPNDVERRAWLLQTVQAARRADGREMDEAEIACFSRASLEEMEEAFVGLTMDWARMKVLPALLEECERQSQAEEEPGMQVDNAGALAAAVYMSAPAGICINNPACWWISEAIGACAELLEKWNTEDVEDWVDGIAIGLLYVSVTLACLCLLVLMYTLIPGTVALFTAEVAVAEVPAIIVGSITAAAEVLGGMVKLALGSAALAAVIEIAKRFWSLWRGESVSTAPETVHHISV